MLLEQGLLPDIRHSSKDDLLFQQDMAPHWHTIYMLLTCASIIRCARVYASFTLFSRQNSETFDILQTFSR